MKFYSVFEIKRDEEAERVEVWERGQTMKELVWKPETNRSLEEVSVEARIKIEANRSLGRRWCKCKGKKNRSSSHTVIANGFD
jgi:hypothetical protein